MASQGPSLQPGWESNPDTVGPEQSCGNLVPGGGAGPRGPPACGADRTLCSGAGGRDLSTQVAQVCASGSTCCIEIASPRERFSLPSAGQVGGEEHTQPILLWLKHLLDLRMDGASVLQHQLKPKLRDPLKADAGATASASTGFLGRDPFMAGRCCSGPGLPTLLALENRFLQRPGGPGPAKQMVNGKISASHSHSGKNLGWR